MPVLASLISFAVGYRIDAVERSLLMMPCRVVHPLLDLSQDFLACIVLSAETPADVRGGWACKPRV
jgi:hypothetical protein